MKKTLFTIVLLTLAFSISCSALAAEPYFNEIQDIESVEIGIDENNDDITPLAVLTLNFSYLAADKCAYSAETYYVSNENSMIVINSATWGPPSQTIGVGWYNVKTGQSYYATFPSGSIVNFNITSVGVPDGDYKIVVKNCGTTHISGSMQYRVT